jgi:hypothetical protein
MHLNTFFQSNITDQSKVNFVPEEYPVQVFYSSFQQLIVRHKESRSNNSTGQPKIHRKSEDGFMIKNEMK